MMTAPSTWPVGTDTKAMSLVRNRAMIPVVVSLAVEIAVPSATLATVMIRMPGDEDQVLSAVAVAGRRFRGLDL